MATWIIDGNNLLHRDPQLRSILQQSGFSAARRFLEAELGRRRGGGHAFHLIYDGGGGGRGSGSVTIHVAARGKSADEEILRLARRYGGTRDLKVVTSDRHDIGTRLADLSVEWVSVENFRRVLWDRGRTPGGAAARPEQETAAEKPRPPRGSEVDHWLREFGVDPAGDHDNEGGTG